MQGSATSGTRASVGKQKDTHWRANDGAQPLFLNTRDSFAVSSPIGLSLAVVL